jgi:hypothetical protein
MSQPFPAQWGIAEKVAYVRCVLEEKTLAKLLVFLPVPEIRHIAPQNKS